MLSEDPFSLDWDDCPLSWLELLGLRVVSLRVPPGESALAIEIDQDDTQVVADQLIAKGDPIGENLLRAVLEGRTFYLLHCKGDCCSESWLADVVGVDALLGERVLEAGSVDLPEHLTSALDANDEPRSRQSIDKVYGFEIKTAKGVCTLAMRNSSNGYYGGSMDFGGFVDPDTIQDRTLERWDQWRMITEDWSA